MSKSVTWIAGITLLAGVIFRAHCCEPCALYNLTMFQRPIAGTVSMALSEQYTSFTNEEDSTLSQRDDETVQSFSTTQLSAGYQITERVGVQLSMPFIFREFDETKNFRTDSETESGIGDMAILGTATPILVAETEWATSFSLYGGIKLPTGDTGSLSSIEPESGGDEEDPSTAALRHHQISSASGGRALTLGTGSIDFVTGLVAFARYERLLFIGTAQYIFRNEGDFDYTFDDDFIFTAGAGGYLLLDDNYSAALRPVLTGEFKGSDTRDGELVSGSKYSNLYLGPDLLVTYGSFACDIAVDIRTTSPDPGAEVVPSYRLRMGVSYSFS